MANSMFTLNCVSQWFNHTLSAEVETFSDSFALPALCPASQPYTQSQALFMQEDLPGLHSVITSDLIYTEMDTSFSLIYYSSK